MIQMLLVRYSQPHCRWGPRPLHSDDHHLPELRSLHPHLHRDRLLSSVVPGQGCLLQDEGGAE